MQMSIPDHCRGLVSTLLSAPALPCPRGVSPPHPHLASFLWSPASGHWSSSLSRPPTPSWGSSLPYILSPCLTSLLVELLVFLLPGPLSDLSWRAREAQAIEEMRETLLLGLLLLRLLWEAPGKMGVGRSQQGPL